MSEEEFDKRLIWLDIETTGLNPHEGEILEIAMRVTDEHGLDLDEPCQFHEFLYTEDFTERAIEEASSWVVETHTNSGLIGEVFARGISFEDAENNMKAWITDKVTPRNPLVVAGSSVGFDVEWMGHNFVGLLNNSSWFTYRVIDVSSIKEICRRVNPDLYSRLPEHVSKHRAESDIADSIAEYRWYLENFLYV